MHNFSYQQMPYIELGFDASINNSAFIAQIPSHIIIYSERGVKFITIRKRKYKVLEISSSTPISILQEFCSHASYTLNASIYHTYIKCDEKVDRIGVKTYLGSRSSFIMIGFYDKQCDLFFPRSGVKSDIFPIIILWTLDLPLPTNPNLVEKRLKEKSFEIEGKLEPSVEFRTKMLMNLIYATLLYHSDRIWQEGVFPDQFLKPFIKSIDRTNMIPHDNLLSNRDLIQIEKYSLDVRKGKIPKKPITSIPLSDMNENTSLEIIDPEKTQHFKQYFLERYPHLTPTALQEFFDFLVDVLRNDEAAIQQFFAIVSPMLQNDIKISIIQNEKKGVRIEYFPTKF